MRRLTALLLALCLLFLSGCGPSEQSDQSLLLYYAARSDTGGLSAALQGELWQDAPAQPDPGQLVNRLLRLLVDGLFGLLIDRLLRLDGRYGRNDGLLRRGRRFLRGERGVFVLIHATILLFFFLPGRRVPSEPAAATRGCSQGA